jgi:hypothetical protein
MASAGITRLNYFQRQFLNAQDFQAEQAYHRGMRRRHNLGQHTWGIVEGLELLEKARESDAPFVDIWIQPGMAVDGFGREIFVLEPIKLDATLFDAFANLFHREVWIAFNEEKGNQAGTGIDRCDTTDGFTRLRETALPVIEPLAPTHDPIILAGVEVEFPPLATQGDLAIPEDLSVPEQQLTNPDTRKWLIRLGSVNWDGSLGVKKFRPAAAGRLMEGREYVSLIGSQVLSPSASLRLAPRATPTDADAADFASVDGRLQVNGRIVAKKDIFLHGGKLNFYSTAGLDEGAPLWMQRLPAVAEHELRIHIGDDDAEPKNRLTVGPLSGGKEKPVLMVTADDHVSILSGKLDFDAATRQMINLWKEEYGIGVQAGALYFRTSSDFYWWKGGKHKDDPADAANGQMQMRLDPDGNLLFGTRERQMLNLWDTVYGIGIQDNTLYFRTDFDYCWYRGGSHRNGRSDPGGGRLMMKLDENNVLSLNGTMIARGDIQMFGTRLDFRMPDGGTDTDLLQILRFNRGFDTNDLRVIIGDNLDGSDRFTVGPVSFIDGLYKEQFVVLNNGDVQVAKRLFVGGAQVPIDVRSGFQPLGRVGAGTGTDTIEVTSRLSSVSGAEIMVALADIRNAGTAVNARWRVVPGAAPLRLTANRFRFFIDWQVDDSDGELQGYSWIVIFTP